ncbi:peroxiredoxin family protein [Oceanirhabdus seepicola]|uniref:Redoxin domain-containing protein n=1 Tax=Oceanirhabdus seepicola TaxID=2828781 RepID=A0A9J6P594_9CLOT|nr:redoxin domain-containing protein [Oceanirhabdus seepicola]MCM1991326.1 redoxin domain-containing protein [Oceanirhabdus seepicola]
MKRSLSVILLIGIVSTVFVGCQSKPTTQETLQAVSEGKLTYNDAIEKGYITKEYLEENGYMQEAGDKIASAPKLNNFTTTDINGEEVTQEVFKNGENGVYVIFWNTSNEDSITEINELNKIYEKAVENEFEIVGVVVDSDKAESAKEIAKNIKFKNILLNDEMKETLGKGLEMLENLPIAVYSNSNGDLITAWYIGVTDKEKVIKSWEKSSSLNEIGK